MVLPFIELVHRLTALKRAAAQQAGLLKLGEHPVHRGQAHIGAVLQQNAVYIFGRHMPLRAVLEHLQYFQTRYGRFEAGVFEFVDIGHSLAFNALARVFRGYPRADALRASRYNDAIISPHHPSCPPSISGFPQFSLPPLHA